MDPMPTILDTLAGEAVLHRPSGGFGHLPVERLPKGWANLTIHRKDRSRIDGDSTTEYYGPILQRTPEWVSIEVFRQPVTVPLKSVFITEGTA